MVFIQSNFNQNIFEVYWTAVDAEIMIGVSDVSNSESSKTL